MDKFKTWEELTILEQLGSIFSDMYKDAYGVRPRGISTHLWDEAKFRRELDFLESEISKNMRQQEEQEATSAQDFEDRVRNICGGQLTRAEAIQQIMQADGAYDFDHLEFINGLAYGYLREDQV